MFEEEQRIQKKQDRRKEIIHVQCNHDQKTERKTLQKFSFLLPCKKKKKKKRRKIYMLHVYLASKKIIHETMDKTVREIDLHQSKENVRLRKKERLRPGLD